METEIVKRNTVEEIVRIYTQLCREVKAGYRLLDRAKTRMRAQIYQYGNVVPKNRNCFNDFDDGTLQATLKELKAHTWRGIVDRLNVRSIMGKARRDELDKQLETGEGLPDIETEAICKVIINMTENLSAYMTDAIREAFEMMLRKSDGYKSTEQAFMIGDKVVLGWMTEQRSYCSGDGKFRVQYRASDSLVTLENAFSLLDGKGPIKSYKSAIEDAINASPTGEGETTYFRFRAHKNGNLHLWFRRMDLVKELNAIGAGGSRALNKVA